MINNEKDLLIPALKESLHAKRIQRGNLMSSLQGVNHDKRKLEEDLQLNLGLRYRRQAELSQIEGEILALEGMIKEYSK